jgi:molybdopterin adenylyltransferase
LYQYSILTVSDRGSAGLREDSSGAAIREILAATGIGFVDYVMVPDERDVISAALIRLCGRGVNLILTTGGTGLAPRDVTPEATLDVIERQVPGIPEAMRAQSMAITPRAMLSRAVAGVRGRCLIINLPGSPKAVRECLEVLLPVLDHALQTLSGSSGDCAR